MRLYVVLQGGQVHRFENRADVAGTELFLDLGSRVRSGGEEGLLGLAFHPDFAENGWLYVYYTAGKGPRRSVIARYKTSGDTGIVDPGSEKVLLEIPQPYANHNGGMLAFGPDRMLYVAVGDGGGAGDPKNHAQDPRSLLGKILRLNPDGTVPADNPYADAVGARGEIWALGLRNPWRFSFDRDSGALWAGDVGQNEHEEVNLIVRSGNYGWRLYEGNTPFRNPRRRPATDFVSPVTTYSHELGCSITGGYVYRGKRLPAFVGHYFYSDFCSGRLWALELRDSFPPAVREVGTVPSPSSFGEDATGELYITSFDGRIYRLGAP